MISISNPPPKPSKLGNPVPGLMALLVMVAILGFLAALLLPHFLNLIPSAPLHLALAVGVMPLILGAMTYFIPVLTRTGAPAAGTLAPPLAGLAAGLMLFTSLALAFQYYPLAAGLALAAVGGLSWWAWRRSCMTLGKPHPGLLWYQLALGALALGLAAIMLAAFWPEQWVPLRRLHLHLNLLGFVGLTTLGTLRVLLPTVGGFNDPQAGPWLMGEWRWLAGGTLLIAAGAAWLPLLSVVGLLLWLISLGRLIRGLLPHRRNLWQWHGAAPSLAAAIAGLLICLLAGAAHGLGLPVASPSQAFVLAFLLPLVTGAATHLLPLWLYSQSPEKQSPLRKRLGQLSGLRGLLFLAAGLLTLAGQPWAYALAILALGHFVFQLVWGMMKA